MSHTGSRRVKGSYFVSTISIALVLVVVGALVFILLNARMVSDHVKRNIGFVVIIKDNTNEAEIKRVQKILDTRPYTYSSQYITKEQAAVAFKKEMGEDFEAILGANPLLPSIEIKLNPAYANNDSLAMVEKGLAKFDIIHDIYYQKSMIQSINENIRRISVFFLIVGAVLMLISFTLIRNTIHLAVYSQRFLIKTMQLVGAKPFFICKPFVYDSMWRGFFGAMIANLVLLGAIFFLQENIGRVMNIIHRDTIVIMVVFVVLCGMFLSFISAWYSVYRYLNRDLNELYT
ncbi:permease-like cell division protein FtsX [uncultured Sanguibacteroides sp.]|uniref:cell division protein FtsX n=1 Tax=uncultured Sanguibacteroides sp. TaxID=1635151 RepID=UPI0025F5B5DC|nr:permease-like cell division protein FtsX [uncultured Sanguibacteroides sp.]